MQKTHCNICGKELADDDNVLDTILRSRVDEDLTLILYAVDKYGKETKDVDICKTCFQLQIAEDNFVFHDYEEYKFKANPEEEDDDDFDEED